MAGGDLAAWSLVTPSTMSPTVLMVPRASSGMSMLKASSTSKEMLILSRESMLSSSKVLAGVMVSAGMLFDLAMISMQRLATSFMMVQLPSELASTYRDARADVKVVGVPCTASAGKNAQAVGGEGLERGVADVGLEKALEEPGGALEGAEDGVAQARGTIHEEQAAGHDAGEALDAAVGLVIEAAVAGTERVGESRGLARK